ncbi:hypothetical protein [Lentzea aerocolonigenes]|uniref:hypothetical protein n=1 Tax=Lentzea aerocolonigenes TaxID=68170 RepID=UPI0004C2B306|nr:hypothetical protein [Lentzea aerocolonigenes]MCP2251156.1 hypothetical protein [Lentzea aerocolonigenes]
MSEQLRWLVIWDENDAIPAAVVRVHGDGTEETFSRDLVWERSDLRHRTHIPVREASPEEAQAAMNEMIRLMRLCARRDWDGPYQYYGIFRHERDSVDLENAYKIVRHSREDGRDPHGASGRAEQWDFATEDGWSDTDVLWQIGRASINSEAVPITPAEAEQLMASILERRRASGN